MLVSSSNREKRFSVISVFVPKKINYQYQWREGWMITRCVKKSTNRITNFRHLSRTLLLCPMLITAGIFLSTVKSETRDPMRYMGGLRNSPDAKKLNPKQLDCILKSLREKTGFSEMFFDENGFLNLGDRAKFDGGSDTARALFSAAVDSSNSIDLQSHNHSPTVAFARLDRATIYQSRATGKVINVYPLEIDFSDFSKLRGDKQVIAAFDVGIVIMHEIAHAVLGLRDPTSETEGPGECEIHINRIRRELNLPERENYIARTRTVPFAPSIGTRDHAELTFVHPGEARGFSKPQKFSLIWEAIAVGPIRTITTPVQKTIGVTKTTASY